MCAPLKLNNRQPEVTKAEMTAISLTQPGEQVRIDRLDIQRAQSAVLVTVDGIEYAIVSDDNHFTMDPYWQAMYEAPTFLWTPSGAPLAIGGSTTAKKVAIGGKLGIIADPFGKQGEAKYLGATLPLDGYGIINLGVSENGTVLIGQLKGSYSSNLGIANNAAPGSITPGWNIAFPSQSHAWNVADLIHAAVAMPDKDRMSKHINVQAYPNIEQLVKNNVGLVAGTFFDDGPVVVNVNDGRMGDVVEVDLKKLAADVVARELLKLAKDLPETAMTAAQRNALIKKRDEVIQWSVQNFTLNADTIDDSDTADFKLIRAKGNSASSVIADPYTRLRSLDDNSELVIPFYKFKDTGRMYLAPNITATDETTLRNGGRITDKVTTLLFKFQAQNEIGLWEWRQGIVTVTAKDIPVVQTFFGDRPLDNPGYSKFGLSGSVGVGSSNTNDLLDVYRVEQRLKYLGFPAMGSDTKGAPTASNNTIQDFTVDGNWGKDESLAAYLFGDVVNYGDNGHRQLANPTVTKTKTVNGVTTTYQAPRGGSAVPNTPAANRSAYFNDLYGIANSFTINQAGTFSYSSPTNTPSSGTGQFLSYLGAYNAPHWMNVYQSIQNITGFTVTSGMTPGSEEFYGVSWVRDLMVASTFSDSRLQPGSIRFNGLTDANHGQTPFMHGTHDLGMAFDLGVSGNIGSIAQNNELEQLLAILATVPTSGAWNVDNAADYSSRLSAIQTPATQKNDQVSAIRRFLSLYAVTQSNSWGAMSTHIMNSTAARDALFGSGIQDAKQLISKVIIGGITNSQVSQNPYPNMHKVLAGLGIATDPNVINHNSHFHIYLNPPTPVGIIATQHLLADTATTATSTPATLQTDAQGLLDYSQNLITGEELMFTMDVPYAPAQQAPIVLAQAAAPATPQSDYLLKLCQQTQSTGDPRSAFRGVDPAGWLALELGRRSNRDILNNPTALGSIKVSLLEGTMHGKIFEEVDNVGMTSYHYDPIPDYVGNDKAIFMAEFEGKRYKIVINLVVTLTVGESPLMSDETPVCPPPKLIKVNNKPVSGSSGYDFGSVTVTFADLTGGALGQTTGNAITLDTNAAGNNWYIDTTPSLNEEYLPTSNPNEWVAKAGSAAAGKMDMLTVLLHEYGHALGIDHNPDAHDYMGTTLTAGIRRLPTADELALMGQLIAQAKNGLIAATPSPQPSPTGGEGVPSNVPFPTLPLGGMSLAFAGLLQRNRYGSLNAVLNNSTLTQYDVAANSTLTNGSLNNGNGWATQGSVNIGNGVATLNETTTTQTRLNQVFMVNANDRYLSFTLSGAALGNLPHPNPLPMGEGTNGTAFGSGSEPSDAFEVALLNANPVLSNAEGTGASLLGSNASFY